MTTALLSETRPFNQSAAAEVVEKALSLDADSDVGLVLSMRAPGNVYDDIIDECLYEINALAKTVQAKVEPFDTFVDADRGEIRLKASPNFAILLVQENDLFWSVALDDQRR